MAILQATDDNKNIVKTTLENTFAKKADVPAATEVAAELVKDTKKEALGKAVLDLKEGEKHVLAEQLKSYSELKGVDEISTTTHNQDADNLPDYWTNLI